jgi:inosine/guanosine/xanthosine phosphorylase family protein
MDHVEAAEAIAATIKAPMPEDLVVLGSGLGPFADSLEARTEIPYESIPHFPASTVAGHAGRLVVGRLPGGGRLVCMQGRMHYYEGYAPEQIAVPIRALAALGVRRMVMTNASGGISEHLHPGDLMLIDDHINLTGRNPLAGPNDDAVGPRFPDMSEAWDPALSRALEAAGERAGVALKRGVYVQVLGPSFETPAEIRMLARLGADAVGMSTVPECIVARHAGVRVAGISLVTNYAAGRVAGQVLTLEEALAVADDASETLRGLLREFYAGGSSGSSR